MIQNHLNSLNKVVMYFTYQESKDSVGTQNSSLSDDVDLVQSKGQHRQKVSLGINDDTILPNEEKKQELTHKYDTQ